MASLADVSRAIMRSARTAPKLEAAEEKALLQRFRTGGDTGALDRLSAANLRRVISLANGLRGYGLPLDDLVQEGCFGMMLAAYRYDLDRDVPFGAYARHWMKAGMRQFILRNWSLVRAASGSAEEKLFFRLRALRSKLEADPTMSSTAVTQEIAAAFGVSATDVEIMQARLSLGDVSLNAPASMDEDDGAEVGDYFASELPSTDDLIDDDQCAADLRSALQALDEQERFIVEQRKRCL